MVGIVCKDIKESLRFYSLLGVEVPTPEEGEPYCEAKLPGGIRLSWNDLEMVKGIEGDWTEPAGQRTGLAFLCDSPAEVDSTYRAILAAGFSGHKEPWDAFWGQRYAQVVDPDGNHVDLFAPL